MSEVLVPGRIEMARSRGSRRQPGARVCLLGVRVGHPRLEIGTGVGDPRPVHSTDVVCPTCVHKSNARAGGVGFNVCAGALLYRRELGTRVGDRQALKIRRAVQPNVRASLSNVRA